VCKVTLSHLSLSLPFPSLRSRTRSPLTPVRPTRPRILARSCCVVDRHFPDDEGWNPSKLQEISLPHNPFHLIPICILWWVKVASSSMSAKRVCLVRVGAGSRGGHGAWWLRWATRCGAVSHACLSRTAWRCNKKIVIAALLWRGGGCCTKHYGMQGSIHHSPRPVAWLASVGGVVPPGCDSDMHTLCRNAIRCTAILIPSPLVWISDELVCLVALAARCQCGPSFRPTSPPCTIALAA
jgi:hypothetical protein